MKIGVCLSLDDGDFRTKAENIASEGFHSCQVLSWNPARRTPEMRETILDTIRRTGIEITAFWCGWEGPAEWNFYTGPTTLGLLPEAYREMRIGNLCEGADFALSLGVKDVATHMGFIPENPNDPAFVPFCDAIRRVALHLKENGQNFLFETGQETPTAMKRCFETVGTDNLFVNLDTANLILYGKANPVDALDTIGTYVRNLHAKDGFYPVNGHDLGAEARLGDGKVDFRALFTKLHDLGYDGPVTIEREIGGEQQRDDIRYAKRYLAEIIGSIYGEEHVC